MNVYPDNQIENISLRSDELAKHSDIKYLYHPYLDVASEFMSSAVTIYGETNISRQIYCDSVILANTNATMACVELYDSSGTILFDSGSQSFGGGVLIINLDTLAYCGSFKVTLSGDSNLYLGLLHFGIKIELPRFIVNPVQSIDLRNQAERSLGGQSYGFISKPLRNFSAQFQRIGKEDMDIIRGYVERTQTVVPHIIDPYPDAHEAVMPFYATLSDGISYTKRNENGFFYDLSLSWLEAK